MSFSKEDLDEFKAEALDLLEIAEKSLLALDSGAEFKTAFDSIFRGFHNLKGAAGIMDMEQLQAHTHELENILMGFKGDTSISKKYINLFLQGIDAAKVLLDGGEVQFDYSMPQPVILNTPNTSKDNNVILDSTTVDDPLEVKDEKILEQKDVSPETMGDFFVECEEIIERVSKHLQSIESGESTKDHLDGLYRDVHSLKGAAYLFSYKNLGDLAHIMESSLERVRSGTHSTSPSLLNGLFKCLEMIEKLLLAEKNGTTNETIENAIPRISKAMTKIENQLPSLDQPSSSEEVSVLDVEQENTQKLEQEQEQEQKSKQVNQLVPKFEETIQKNDPAKPHAANEIKNDDSTSSIRVPVALLDSLMALMGEMVLVRNQVLQFSNKSEDAEFISMSKRLNVVTSEIQAGMMKTRMQPIGNVLGKFTRVIRDLSQDLGKKINLSLTGTETELDKSLLEAIKDPLTHLVRNSCDHGIESPNVRKAAGKSEIGTVSIKAYHEGGQVVIDIQDDGKGLHREVILNKAIEKGVINKVDATKLSEKQIFNLIFAPGFSTAAKITNVSGRGVGMDVVRTNIERIGGTVDLSSVAGQGTLIKIKIPLTLAIVPALTVKCRGGTFAIPQVNLEELVRVDQSMTQNKIEFMHGTPVFRLRGSILPLVDLNVVLDIEHEVNYKDGIVNIAVLNAEQSSFGLIIDQIQDTVDIVVKPLNRLLKSLLAYSGATILGDGSVAFILDVIGISKLAHLKHEKIKTVAKLTPHAYHTNEAQDYLLIKVASPTRHALVLGYVHRLEEFKVKDIEYSGSQRVVRYGNTILPLISVNKGLGYSSTQQNQEIVPTVVIRRADHLYGLEVDAILDTLSSEADLNYSHINNPAIFGNLNTTDELIVVIDPFELIESVFPQRLGSQESLHSGNSMDRNEFVMNAAIDQKKPDISARILLAEDTIFFRKAIKDVLQNMGHEVVAASDGQEAIDLLNQAEKPFDLIVSDIEMPRVNGFQLANAVRNHPKYSSMPMMAVSSKAGLSFMKECKKAGFNIYMEKLRPNMLENAVNDLLSKEKSAV